MKFAKMTTLSVSPKKNLIAFYSILLTNNPYKDRDRIRILRGVMVQSGADLPQSVLDLAKPDLNDKKRVKRQKIEREELQTKVPKCNFEATERVNDF